MAKKIKAPKHPIGAELTYREQLLKYVRKVVEILSDDEYDDLADEMDSVLAKSEAVGDAISAHVLREIKRNFKNGLPKSSVKERTARAIGVDDSAKLDRFIFNNTLLIKNITEEIRIKIFDELRKDPTGIEPVFSRIKQSTGFADARARLIARDQTAKLNSELSGLRHKAAGFTRYTWATSGDERVRAEHADLDGNIYQYDEPTDEQDGLPPGQPIQCRCIAEPIFEELEDVA